jgi:hypothetical protein
MRKYIGRDHSNIAMQYSLPIVPIVIGLGVSLLSFLAGVVNGYVKTNSGLTAESNVSIFQRSVRCAKTPGLLIFVILVIANAYIQLTIGYADMPSDWVIIAQFLIISILLFFLVGVPMVIGSFVVIVFQTG